MNKHIGKRRMHVGRKGQGGKKGREVIYNFLTQSVKTTGLSDSPQPSVKSCVHIHTCLNRYTCSRANKYIRARNEHNVRSGTYVTLMHTHIYQSGYSGSYSKMQTGMTYLHIHECHHARILKMQKGRTHA